MSTRHQKLQDNINVDVCAVRQTKIKTFAIEINNTLDFQTIAVIRYSLSCSRTYLEQNKMSFNISEPYQTEIAPGEFVLFFFFVFVMFTAINSEIHSNTKRRWLTNRTFCTR